MAWIVEQQARSGLGELVWLKAAGPFNFEAEAAMIADRLTSRNGLSSRLVPAPCPPAEALDRVYEGRPCRVLPGAWYHRGLRSNTVDIEFADGGGATVSAELVKRR